MNLCRINVDLSQINVDVTPECKFLDLNIFFNRSERAKVPFFFDLFKLKHLNYLKSIEGVKIEYYDVLQSCLVYKNT